MEQLVPGVLGVREDDGDELRLLVFELGSCGGRCWRALLLGLYDLHQRARVDPQEKTDTDQKQDTDAPARKRRPGAHAAAILDVRALLSTSPAQLGLWIPELRLELVFDALAAALVETR